MNLQYATNTCCRLFPIILAMFILYACDQVEEQDSVDDGESVAVNIIAIHNLNSSLYDDNCLKCHDDIPNKKSLDSTIPNAHVAMLAFTPGKNSKQCVWCHRNVSANLIQAASAISLFETNIRKHVDTQLCAICHGPVGPGKQFYQSGITTSANLDGEKLYHHLCSACHKELAQSKIKGASAQEIYKAILENEGGMAPLNVLSSQWIQAITEVLGGDTTLPSDNTPTSGIGSSLYQQYCTSCHGVLASSNKTGATASQIQTAIDNDTGGMTSFSFLTTTQIQDIADALGGTGAVGTDEKDGAKLYASYCSSCHSSLDKSQVGGKSVSDILEAIEENKGGMSSLKILTLEQIDTIAAVLPSDDSNEND